MTLIFPIQFFGSTHYYAAMAAALRRGDRVIVDDLLRYDKRFKSAHRMVIADTRGSLTLTLPVAKPGKSAPKAVDLAAEARVAESEVTVSAAGGATKGVGLRWSDIRLSVHGEWWESMAESLASAYGRTPFYEFYIDRFSQFFDRDTVTTFDSVASIDRSLDRLVRRILLLDPVTYLSDLTADVTDSADSHRVSEADMAAMAAVAYYQVRADKLGFIPDLSILDLIFNLGPEAPLLLRAMESTPDNR